MDNEPEGRNENYPNWVSLKTIEDIIKQMKTKICKIYLNNGMKGTGFFCKIFLPINKKLLNVLITNNHVIDESVIHKKEKIRIHINNKAQKFELDNRIIFTNKKYDITILEIKKMMI